MILAFFCGWSAYSQNAGGNLQDQSTVRYACEDEWIEVMFAWESKVRLRNGNLVDLATGALQGVDQALVQATPYAWHRIADVPEASMDLWELNGERNTGTDLYNLNNIYRLKIPKGLA